MADTPKQTAKPVDDRNAAIGFTRDDMAPESAEVGERHSEAEAPSKRHAFVATDMRANKGGARRAK